MRTLQNMLFATALVAGATAADAATITGYQGTVLANAGQGFRQVTAGTEVAPGTRIMVNPGGNAQITYSSTCIVRLPVAGVYVVPTEQECLAAQNNPAANVAANTPWNLSPINVALDAALIGGGVAGIVALSGGSSSSSSSAPASP